MAAVEFGCASHETALAVMQSEGRETLFSGGQSHGQSHAKSLGQIVADTLGVPLKDVEVVRGDMQATPFGTGTYNSQTMAVSESSAMKAAKEYPCHVNRDRSALARSAREGYRPREGRLLCRGRR